MTNDLCFVYRWTHIPTGKWYIGSRTAKNCHPDDGYICSSKYVKPLILSNPDEWEREIITYGSAQWMRIVEFNLLQVADIKNNSLSLNRGNFKCPEITSSQNKHRMNKNDVNIMVNKHDIDLYLRHGWKLGFSKGVKNKMIQNHADVSGKNNPMYGVKRVAPFKGRSHSQNTKDNMQQIRLLHGNGKYLFVDPEGIIFVSASQAARAYGVSQPTIVRWAKRNTFGWKRINK